MQELLDALTDLLGIGLEPKSFSMWQMILRAVVIYLAGWLLVRGGEHRFLGKNTAFDVVLGFIFGSMLSRAINGSGPMIETIVAGAILLVLHWAFVTLSYHSDRLDSLINGNVRRLVTGGEIDRENLRKARISERVLRENLRLNGGLSEPSQVQEANFEPSGNVSVISKREARVVEISVEDGVQTVRVEIG